MPVLGFKGNLICSCVAPPVDIGIETGGPGAMAPLIATPTSYSTPVLPTRSKAAVAPTTAKLHCMDSRFT